MAIQNLSAMGIPPPAASVTVAVVVVVTQSNAPTLATSGVMKHAGALVNVYGNDMTIEVAEPASPGVARHVNPSTIVNKVGLAALPLQAWVVPWMRVPL